MTRDRAPAMLGAWYGLLVMILASAAANAIPPLMLLVTEPMKHDLHLSDTQIGAMRGIGLTLVVAIASYPVGWLADRVDRRAIYAVCVIIWCLAVGLSGYAGGYGQMFACAMGIAVGEAVLGPITFSLIPDLFPAERRMVANSVFFISQLLGFAAGLAIGGLLLKALDQWRSLLPAALSTKPTWRLALMVNALPCLVLVPMILAIRLPPRRCPPLQAPAGEPPTRDAMRPDLVAFFRAHARTLFPIYIGFSAIGAANFTVFGWMSVAVVRMFKESAADVGVRMGEVFAASSILGVIAANLLARLFARHGEALAPTRVAQAGATAALGLSAFYLVAATPWQFYLIATFQIAASMGGLTLSPTVSQAMAPARLRARAIAVGGIFYTVFGALSPLMVGLISDALGPGPRKLLIAMFIVAAPAFILGVLMLRLGERGLPATIQVVLEDDAMPSSAG